VLVRLAGRRWFLGSLGAVATATLAAPALVARDARRLDPGAIDPPVAPVGGVHAVAAPDGGVLQARVCGRGRPTFVLTHGLCCDHALWAYQARLLAELGRVVTWDLRGHGASASAYDGKGLLDPHVLARDLAAVVDALADGPVFLLGHSLGGMVTLLALRDHARLRARTAGAVLIATPVTDVARSVVAGGGLSGIEAAAVRRLLRWLVGDALVDRRFVADRGARARSYAIVRTGGFGAAPSPAHVRAFRDAIAATAPRARRATLAGMFGVDLRGTLGVIQVPTLVVIGGRDRLVNPRQSLALADELPHARAVVFARAGHAVVLERHAAITRRVALLVEQVLAGDGDLDRVVDARW
jgi:non-heme chloroperoxidase